MIIFFGTRAWERSDEEQAPESCGRCRGGLPKDGRHYCAACAAVPGGEHRAASDDRVPAEEEPAPRHAVCDVEAVTIRKGITIPAKYARKVLRERGAPTGA